MIRFFQKNYLHPLYRQNHAFINEKQMFVESLTFIDYFTKNEKGKQISNPLSAKYAAVSLCDF